MNYYKKIRLGLKIPFTEMAKKLKLPEDKYKEMEEGKRKMPKEYLDNLMKLKHESKSIKTEFDIKTVEINNFIKTLDINKKMIEFGYKKQSDLAKAIGINKGTLSLLKHCPERVKMIVRTKVYNFFNDELNIKVNTEKEINNTSNSIESSLEEPVVEDNVNISDKAVPTQEECQQHFDDHVTQQMSDDKYYKRVITELEYKNQQLQHTIDMYEKLIKRL